MRCMRAYLALALSLVLVLTSHSMAQARGMAAPAGEMVICTGSGYVTVLTDAEGQPVGPSHICPDCALSLFAALGGGFEAPVLPLSGGARVTFDYSFVAPSLQVLRAHARGPPLFI